MNLREPLGGQEAIDGTSQHVRLNCGRPNHSVCRCGRVRRGQTGGWRLVHGCTHRIIDISMRSLRKLVEAALVLGVPLRLWEIFVAAATTNMRQLNKGITGLAEAKRS